MWWVLPSVLSLSVVVVGWENTNDGGALRWFPMPSSNNNIDDAEEGMARMEPTMMEIVIFIPLHCLEEESSEKYENDNLAFAACLFRL